MIRILLLASLLALPAYASGPIIVSSGATQTAVVELYTSEGCNSCPPADRWLSRLVETPQANADVLALSFHVDYWDYLGWKDRFSSADFTSRQRQLGANNRQRTIYTPEFFVNGMEARGSNTVLDKIRQANATPAEFRIQLAVTRDQTGLLFDLQAPDGSRLADPAHLRYLVYENNLSTDVKRGENAGKTLRHQRVVRYMSRARRLQRENSYRVEIDPAWNPENVGVAVLVTTPGSLEYLQALHTDVSSLLSASK